MMSCKNNRVWEVNVLKRALQGLLIPEMVDKGRVRAEKRQKKSLLIFIFISAIIMIYKVLLGDTIKCTDEND